MTRRAAWIALLLLIAVNRAVAWQTAPIAPPQRTVLVIVGVELSRPFGLSILGGFREELAGLDTGITVYLESPDLLRFSGDTQTKNIRDYLTRRYGGRQIDAILVFDDPATEFLLGWEAGPFAGLPVVSAITSAGLASRVEATAGWTGYRVVFDFAKTVEAALRLLPGTRHVALVGGRDPFLPQVRDAVAGFKSHVDTLDISDLSLEDTRKRLATLPPDTVVYYSGIWVDGAGKPFTPRSALRQLVPAANQPIFGYADTFLGHGIVGGVVADGARIGAEFARLVHRVISGTPPDSIPVRELKTSRPVFDGRELDRWGLREDRLPPGSQVLFREPTLWQAHQAAVVSTIVVVLSLLTFIAALLLEIQRRRRVQAELRQTSARLINAQEDERSRIARELHDDVSQRLALLALEGEMFVSGDEGTLEDRRAGAKRLIGQARALASDIHRISHELHPAVLDQMGLVPAVRHFVEDLARLHEIRIVVEEADWPEHVAPGLELVFYRVIQEALQNVVRHSGAREARVVLSATPRELSLSVSDKGRGYDPAVRHGASLGLAGMTERLRQIGGRLSVESAPDQGTTIRAVVDRNAQRP